MNLIVKPASLVSIGLVLGILFSTEASAAQVCRAAPFAQILFATGTCAGCGRSAASWESANAAAIDACVAEGCRTGCSASPTPTQDCRYVGAFDGYECFSYCFTPEGVSEVFCASCGNTEMAWMRARASATDSCAASCATGTCTTSASSTDQCAFDSLTSTYRCRSTCVCTPMDAGPPGPDAGPFVPDATFFRPDANTDAALDANRPFDAAASVDASEALDTTLEGLDARAADASPVLSDAFDDAAAGEADAGSASPSSGCSCRAGGQRGDNGLAFISFIALAAALARRRRHGLAKQTAKPHEGFHVAACWQQAARVVRFEWRLSRRQARRAAEPERHVLSAPCGYHYRNASSPRSLSRMSKSQHNSTRKHELRRRTRKLALWREKQAAKKAATTAA